VPLAALRREPHLRRERLHLLSQSSAAQHLLPPSTRLRPSLPLQVFFLGELIFCADVWKSLQASCHLPQGALVCAAPVCFRPHRRCLNSHAAVLFCPRLAGNRQAQVHIVLDTTLINASIIAWQLCPQTPQWGMQDTTMARVSPDFSRYPRRLNALRLTCTTFCPCLATGQISDRWLLGMSFRSLALVYFCNPFSFLLVCCRKIICRDSASLVEAERCEQA
jgi:hypothetical protein